MKINRSLKFSLLLLALLLYFIVCTPWGVHLYGEVLFKENKVYNYPPHEYPSDIDTTLSVWKTMTLNSRVKQASGIDYNKDQNTFFIVTDQAEIIELSKDFEELKICETISNKPLLLRQGSIEAVDYLEGKLYISGDTGDIQIWQKHGNRLKKDVLIKSVKNLTPKLEAESIAIESLTENMYLGSQHLIAKLDNKGNLIEQFELTLEMLPNRDISEYKISGMDFHNNKLYVLFEYHSAVAIVDPSTGIIDTLFALEGIVEGAGLSVTDDFFYVVVDHELNQPSPGVKLYKR